MCISPGPPETQNQQERKEIERQTDNEELALVIMEAEKPHDLPPAS